MHVLGHHFSGSFESMLISSVASTCDHQGEPHSRSLIFEVASPLDSSLAHLFRDLDTCLLKPTLPAQLTSTTMSGDLLARIERDLSKMGDELWNIDGPDDILDKVLKRPYY